MKRHLILIVTLLVGCFIGWAGSLTVLPVTTTPVAQAQIETEAGTIQKGLFVNLTTDDTWAANMAISIAQTGLAKGMQPVVVFLNVRGVYLADRERMPATEGNSQQNIHQRLQAFIAAGGTVIACPGCSAEAGLTQEDYIDGVTLGEPGGAFQYLMDPMITVISY